jgi:hypothetical protein
MYFIIDESSISASLGTAVKLYQIQKKITNTPDRLLNKKQLGATSEGGYYEIYT